MRILAQHWVPIGNLGIGMRILAQHWVSIGNLGIGISLVAYIGKILLLHWLNVGFQLAIGIGIILLAHIGPLLVFYWQLLHWIHIGNLD